MVLAYLKLIASSQAMLKLIYIQILPSRSFKPNRYIHFCYSNTWKQEETNIQGHRPQQAEEADGAQLHVCTKGRKPANSQHSSENKQKHQARWGTEPMGGADLERVCFAFRNKTIYILLQILNKIMCCSWYTGVSCSSIRKYFCQLQISSCYPHKENSL